MDINEARKLEPGTQVKFTRRGRPPQTAWFITTHEDSIILGNSPKMKYHTKAAASLVRPFTPAETYADQIAWEYALRLTGGSTSPDSIAKARRQSLEHLTSLAPELDFMTVEGDVIAFYVYDEAIMEQLNADQRLVQVGDLAWTPSNILVKYRAQLPS